MAPASQWYQVVLNVISVCLSYTDHYTIRTLLDKHQASCVQDHAWDIKEVNILVNSGEVMPVHGVSFHLLLAISEPSRKEPIVCNVIRGQGLWTPADLFRETSGPQYDFESISFISAIQNIFLSPFWLWKSYCLHKSFPGFSALLWSNSHRFELLSAPRVWTATFRSCLSSGLCPPFHKNSSSIPTSQTSWRLKRNSVFSLRSYYGRLKEEWLDRLTKGA